MVFLAGAEAPASPSLAPPLNATLLFVFYLMIDSSQVPSYVIAYSRVPLGIYAHAHFSNMVLTVDAQKYIIKLHLKRSFELWFRETPNR